MASGAAADAIDTLFCGPRQRVEVVYVAHRLTKICLQDRAHVLHMYTQCLASIQAKSACKSSTKSQLGGAWPRWRGVVSQNRLLTSEPNSDLCWPGHGGPWQLGMQAFHLQAVHQEVLMQHAGLAHVQHAQPTLP